MRGSDYRRNTFTLLLIAVCSILFIAAIPTVQFPDPDAPKVPFEIQAPWPAGLSPWQAAGSLGGSYYGQYLHKNADTYAIDFNYWDSLANRSDRAALVLAAADGIVSESTCKDTGSLGCLVVVGHGLSDDYCYVSRYAHLTAKPLVSPGEWVAQGHPIGRVGSTGLASGSTHLHFAIHRRPVSECSAADRANRKDMAVVPEPLGGIEPIMDGTLIESSTHPVGFEPFSMGQIFTAATPLPRKHQPILDTYKQLGGQYGRFGRALGSVRHHDGATVAFQQFGPYTFNDEFPWYGLSSAIVEHNEKAYYMVSPIWSEYSQRSTKFGLPTSNSYSWHFQGVQHYRNDFDDSSIIWRAGESNEIEVVDSQNGRWQASFFAEPNSFDNVIHRRRDRYLDFSWNDSARPGPYTTDGGFSAMWETSAGGLISAYKIVVEAQGNVQIFVDNEVVIDEESPDAVWSGSSIELGIGAEKVEVRYWQDYSRQGSLRVTVESLFIPQAFASDGVITSESLQSTRIEYASFLTPMREVTSEAPEGQRENYIVFRGRIFDELDTRRFVLEGSGWEEYKGFEDHSWWAHSSDQEDAVTARWLLNPSSKGRWEVFAYIPEGATSRSAQYTVFHNDQYDTVVIDQNAYNERWVSLGVFDFKAQGNEYVVLSNIDAVGERAGEPF